MSAPPDLLGSAHDHVVVDVVEDARMRVRRRYAQHTMKRLRLTTALGDDMPELVGNCSNGATQCGPHGYYWPARPKKDLHRLVLDELSDAAVLD